MEGHQEEEEEEQGSQLQDASKAWWEVLGEHKLVLPIMLASSTALGGVCMLTIQRSLVAQLGGAASDVAFTAAAASLYALTLGLFTYVGFWNPGEVGNGVDPRLPPKRSHKCWQYPRSIRRFDHYCRWVVNCIGLKNHREFFAMLVGLASVAVLGLLVDAALLLAVFRDASYFTDLGLALHMGYSLGLGYYVLPIFRLHAGFVSRNELANEWKNDEFYIVPNAVGEPVWVGDLDEDEFDERFDEFQYDKSRNPWDKGCVSNCSVFWCSPRWSEDQLGEF